MVLLMVLLVTCYGRLDVDHRLLLAQQGSSFVYDTQCDRLLYPALLGEMHFEYVLAWFVRLRVVNVGHIEFVRWRRGH